MIDAILHIFNSFVLKEELINHRGQQNLLANFLVASLYTALTFLTHHNIRKSSLDFK